jgi:hypothetical protein
MESRQQLSRHHQRKHSVLGETSFICDDDTSSTAVPTQAKVVPPIILQSSVLQVFLEHTVRDGMLLALRRFVSSSCFGCRNLQLDAVEEVPLLETFTVLIIARLVFRIGTVNQALLSLLLSVLVISRPKIGPSSLPITQAQLLRVITNASNRTSIYSTIPTPRPVELKARHAYLGLAEVIGHALGLQPAASVIIEKYQRLVNSPRGQQCLVEARSTLVLPTLFHLQKMVCMLTFWFDGWDPNSSMSKANKTPIWSGTVTLIFASMEGTVRFVTTRLAANGPGKADHTEVIQCILDDVISIQAKTLDRQFRVRRLDDYALVYVNVLLVTCDQPERRSITGLLAGNSKLHACFGISCAVSLLFKPLEACPACVDRLKTYTSARQFNFPVTRACVVCLQWTLPEDPGCLGEYKYTSSVDSNFPGDAEAGCHLNTHAGMVTSSLLLKAWAEAYDKWVVQNVWTSKQVEAYFKVLTINEGTTGKFLAQGRRCQLANAFRLDPDSVGGELLQRDLADRMIENPTDYQPMPPPPMWALVELDQLPEAVMHLAMGVVKAVSKFIHGWAASRNKSPYLAERLNFCINMQQRYCRIGRCPMATYSALGKFPGWVADTFRSWWIWMPWFYSVLDNDVFYYHPYVLPTIPPNRWNGNVCAQFLKSRGVPGYTKLKAKEKQQVVLDMSRKDNWPPPAVVDRAFSVTGTELQGMLWHCHSLFKYLFAAPHTCRHRHAANGHVKLLLSLITKLDRLMQEGDNPPNLYEVKYNFISLPRAVRLLDTYGSARNIQEGGTDGEGVVKMLRPLTPRGLKQHFAKNLINAFHRDQQLSEFCNEVRSHVNGEELNTLDADAVMQVWLDRAEQDLTSQSVEDNEMLSVVTDDRVLEPSEDVDDVALDGQQYKKYKSLTILQQYHKLGLPLSFVVANVDNQSVIGFVVRGAAKVLYLVPLCIGKVAYSSTSSFAYFETSLNRNESSWITIESMDNDKVEDTTHSFVNYGHLLPHLKTVEQSSQVERIPYAVVTLDANHMNSTYEFV